MEQGISFNIYCMSYKRADKILTKQNFEYCTYVVREEEADAYRSAGVEDLMVIPKGATLSDGTQIWSFMTTLWWLIENAPEDVIFVADDDIDSFAYYFTDIVRIKDDIKEFKRVTTSEVERIAQLISDLNIGVACDNPYKSVQNYTSEFKFKCCPGGVRWINRKMLKAKFDKDDWATSDVDFVMQELLHNRIILNPRYFTSLAKQNTNEGGSKVTSKENREYILAMKNKWGRYIDFNFKRNMFVINVAH